MLRTISKCVIAAAICVLAFPVAVWGEDYYESNDDGNTHTHYYYYDYSDQEYSTTEWCTWWHAYYDYPTYGEDGHYHVYKCPYCYGEKEVFESCSWKLDYRDYTEWSRKKHRTTTWYDCIQCGNSKKVTTYQRHKIKWVRYGSAFWYECKYCGYSPKYNGSTLMDYNDTDNITIRKGKKYTYYMWFYNKSRNKIKSIKYSKKKICKVKRKGKKLIIKAKKRGKCRVTVKMRSGARYTLKIRVK